MAIAYEPLCSRDPKAHPPSLPAFKRDLFHDHDATETHTEFGGMCMYHLYHTGKREREGIRFWHATVGRQSDDLFYIIIMQYNAKIVGDPLLVYFVSLL